jgi:predicted ribosomally synthesized peptide with SipW-like signal peptide
MVVSAFGLAAGAATHAAFTDTTTNDGDTFTAGSVDIDDDDGGIALVGLTAGNPGDTDTGCITVTYNGSLDSTVRLYGTTAGTGFDQYITLTVERGTWSGAPPAFEGCTGFTPDATDYIGAGAGVVYTGTMADYPDAFAAGIVDGGGTPETWTTGESRPYRFTVTVDDADGAQTLNATQTFTWEARNT